MQYHSFDKVKFDARRSTRNLDN